MMLFFDSGPLISLTMSNLLWLLDKLKEVYKGKFVIPPQVKLELIDKPLKINRFRLEAVQIIHAIRKGTLETIETPQAEVDKLVDLANSIFEVQKRPLHIVSPAEIAVLAYGCYHKEKTVIIDERTIRLLVEDPDALLELLGYRMKRKISYNKKKLKEFRDQVKNIQIIRSAELALVAYEKGFLDYLVPRGDDGKQVLLEAVLWGLKTKGCAITRREIEEMTAHMLQVT